jgi:hypothetical protein
MRGSVTSAVESAPGSSDLGYNKNAVTLQRVAAPPASIHRGQTKKEKQI